MCFNSAETIDYALSSFMEQDYPDKELLIIDGDSQDETVSIARRYEADNVRVISEPDEGMYDALNKGLKLFTGDAVGILNSDDRYSDSRVLSKL
ncbi:glycosyltransferase [Kordiimonas laminariae]|uniref:glycosyltransferase n=1 Tax=Kordiimonas laminariae TaxID=2917717 RepID=UPI003CCFE422|nr:glycosyltransferase [Kordiimonas laminariae]